MNNKREGLRVRYANGVENEVKSACIDFIKWIRRKMSFPIRVTIYITDDSLIQTRCTKEYVPAVFWGPYSLEDKPHIRVAAGDFEESVRMQGYYNTIADIFDSIVHELIHYQQWLINPKFKNGEREATKKAKLMVIEYLDYLEELYNDRVDSLETKMDAESLTELIDMFKKSNDFVGEKIIKMMRQFTEFNDAQDFLIEQTKNKYNEIRAEALISLSHFPKNDKTYEACLRCLYDEDDYVRMRAAEAAGDLCNEEIIPHLIKLLDDKNQLIRGYSAVALGALGNYDDISILEEVLKKEKRNASRLRIYVGLYELGKVEYFNLILKQLTCKSLLVRIAVSYYLYNLVDINNIDICMQSLKSAILKEKDEEVHAAMLENLDRLTEYKRRLR